MSQLYVASGLLTQPSRFKRAESNFQADEKGPQQGDPVSCLCYTSKCIDLLLRHFLML